MAGRRRAGITGAALLVAVALATGCGAGTTDGSSAPTSTPTSTGTPTVTRTPTGSSTVTRSPTTPPATTPAPPRTLTPAPATTTRTGPAVADLPPGTAGVDLEVLPTSAKVVALTFDAGANADGLDAILVTLRDTGTPGTFFLTGDFADTFPAQARRIAAAGHVVGNHTRDHPDLTTLPDAAARTQITAARTRIVAVTGEDPRPWFRFPYGARDARTIGLANDLGYACIRWTVDTLGWQGTSGGRTAASVTDRVLAAARPGGIVLMHVGANPDDGSTLDADALPGVITQLRERGYRFVTLDVLLG